MKPVVTPLHPRFVAKITAVDLSKAIGKDIQRAIEHAMDVYAVCVLPAQHLTDEQQIAFSCLYGPLEIQRVFTLNTRLEHREIFDVSNLDADGSIRNENDPYSAFARGNQLWHTDNSFRQESATWSMLHAKVIPPEGGDTEFTDTRAAYDGLPDAMKTRLEGLVAEHSLWHSRAKLGGYAPTEEERGSLPSAPHKVVGRHPGSGRNALYIAAHASHIVGMPVEEGQALLAELIEFATQPQFVYRHKWQVGDLVIWDNRCTMHRAMPFAAADHVRDLRRTTIIDKAQEVLVR